MAHSANSFHYRPLRTSPVELRLLHIHPATFSSPIRCSLEYVFLDSRPKFEALSYVWGDHRIRLPILLHGEIFHVTQNLECALRHLRSEDTVRTFWIDAICIDQANIPERGQQVQHMGDFYGIAIRTTVWLGLGSQRIRLAFQHILAEAKVMRLNAVLEGLNTVYHRIVEKSTSFTGLGAEQGKIELLALPLSQREEMNQELVLLFAEADRYNKKTNFLEAMLHDIRTELGQGGSCHVRASCIESHLHEHRMDNSSNFTLDRPYNSDAPIPNSQLRTSEARLECFPTIESSEEQSTATRVPEDVLEMAEEGVCDILERPWWERVWVVQEISMSQDVIFQCGDVAATWAEFYRYFLHTSNDVVGESYTSVLNILSMRPQNLDLAQDPQRKSMDLIELLQRFRYCQATDPRDKVYALLGLADDFRDEDLKIDYGLALKQLYIKLTRLFIERQNHLAIFGYVLNTEEDLRGMRWAGLPSWVPDWSASEGAIPFQSTQVTKDSIMHFYKSSGVSSVWLIASHSPDESDDLTVKGFIYDSVFNLCEPVGNLLEEGIDMRRFCTPGQHLTVIQQWENKALEGSSHESPYGPGCSMIEAFWRTIIADAVGDSRATQDAENMFNVWSGRALASNNDIDYTEAYVNAVHKASSRRRFGLSRKNNMFLAPANTQTGDLICVLLGSQTPVIIRQHFGCYQLIGVCYVHGIMDGEAMQEQETGKYELQDFLLR